MNKKTTVISDDLDAGLSALQYDEHAKNLLADKEILAYILKYATDEFKSMPIRDIISCIEETEIKKVPISPGLTNAPKITGENCEDNIPGEGFITFDIKTSAVTKERIKIIIDVEAQKSIKLKYPIEKRMVYYLSRMISSQKNREFVNDDYQNIKKVYSICICMNVEEADKRDSITKFSLSAENIVGNYFPKKKNYDLMTGILICISNYTADDAVPEDERKLIGLLKTLFSDKMTKEEKKESLQSDYDIQMNDNINRELIDMCNLGYGVYERGIERGMERGMARGIEKGELKNLLSLVQKKFAKGKSCYETSDELETDLFIIEQIYEVLENAAPDSTQDELLDILLEKNLLQNVVS